ncbi:hypothetical protein BJV74DRAFT_799341 [Russula compacta]|nr:hypothetical protein BJV74DRAFT_799341 [Russula compacta]
MAHEIPHVASTPDSPRWSGLSPLNLAERVKNGLLAVLKPRDRKLSSDFPGSPHESPLALDDGEQAFSPIGARTGASARLFLTRNPPNTVPSTVVWASPQPAWGQWPCHSFSHCISVLTERDAKVAYVLDPSELPLPPVYECTMDCVLHLWLVVPSRPGCVDRDGDGDGSGLTQLSEEQMRAAVEFYEYSGTTKATNNDEAEVAMEEDGYSSGSEEDARYYVGSREAGAAVLLSCAEGNEVDAVALAVLLLAHHSRRCDRRLSRGRGERCGGSSPTYRASQLIDDDPGVSHVWKGLLEWQDVERVQAALLPSIHESCPRQASHHAWSSGGDVGEG